MKFEEVPVNINPKTVEKDDWDIETWRREYPVDYLKMFKIIMDIEPGLKQMVIFQELKKILSFYIPEKLYKYCSLTADDELNEKKFQTLEEDKIYLADAKELNDPFDGKGFFYDPDQLNSIGDADSHEGNLIEDFTAFIKSASLTTNGINSMPMWAHYAANHKGFCISYDMQDKANIDLISCSHPVQYIEERVDITEFMQHYSAMLTAEVKKQQAKGSKEIVIDDISIIFMQLLFCNLKHSSWEYENEFKCTMAANAKGMPFANAKPYEIYVGINCAVDHEKRLKMIAKDKGIDIYKMCFDELSLDYNMIPQKIK